MPFFLGIDAGTTSLKAALFDEQGRIQSVSRQEYTLDMPRPAWVELDPDAYWKACCLAVRSVMKEAAVPAAEVLSLCISSQGETLIPLDARGRPLRPAIVWLDNRAVEQATAIATRFGLEEVYHHTGQVDVVPTWPACKIIWLRQNEPEVFRSAAKFLLLEDYLLYRLTGLFVTENALQTSSILLDINRQGWWPEMMEYVGLSPERLGRLMRPGEPVGTLSAEGAAALGLLPSTLAVTGSMDQAISAVGAGNILPGVVSESTGGALGIVVTIERQAFDPQRRIPCYFHAIKDRYCLLPWGQTAGMALKWFRDAFFPLEAEEDRQAGLDPYDRMTREAAQVSPGADGLTVLPHLEGAACPEQNPQARAVFSGATLRHTRAHFTRGILEAVAFMLRRNIELVEELSGPIQEIRSTGGGARSPLWLQIKADVLQKPIGCLETEETALLGAALLGAVAAGSYPTPEEAVRSMVRLGDTFYPNPENALAYDRAYDRYIELYDRLAPMFA
jgi:xylulokinase